jgi:hypothetical protein
MNLFKRRIVAFIVGKLISGKEINKLFDRSNSKYAEILGEVTQTNINIYENERNELVTGSGDAKGISLYDFTTAKFIDLKIDKDQFDGFDYESKKVFYGEVKDNTVALFDFQDSKHHYYVMLCPNEEIEGGLGLLI